MNGYLPGTILQCIDKDAWNHLTKGHLYILEAHASINNYAVVRNDDGVLMVYPFICFKVIAES